MGIKEQDKIQLSREEFLHEIKSNYNDFKDKYTIKKIAQFLVDNGFTQKSFGTLSTMSKDNLLRIALHGEEPQKETKKQDLETDSLASTIIDSFDKAKHEIHGTGLNKLVKQWATKTTENLLNKVSPEHIAKVGIFGSVAVYGLLIIDLIFKDMKEVPKKSINFLFPKKEVAPKNGKNINTK